MPAVLDSGLRAARRGYLSNGKMDNNSHMVQNIKLRPRGA